MRFYARASCAKVALSICGTTAAAVRVQCLLVQTMGTPVRVNAVGNRAPRLPGRNLGKWQKFFQEISQPLAARWVLHRRVVLRRFSTEQSPTAILLALVIRRR
jgi:hypothetical protein